MKLMVSVINAEEAKEAASAGADIIDVKNPHEGSLGAQFPQVIREVKIATAGAAEVSAAIGDLPNLPGTAALAALGAATCGVDFVKVGLFGPRTDAEAIYLLHEVSRALCEYPSVRVIAAGYADCKRAGTLDPRRLPEIAACAGVEGCLIDTAIKDGHGLFDFLRPEALQSLAAEAHARGLILGLAGALREQDLPVIRDLCADVAGVRTAVCLGRQRTGSLDANQVRRLREIIASPPTPAKQQGIPRSPA